MSETLRITEDALRQLASRILQAAGLQSDHAATVAEMLVWADARGTSSHGVARLPFYVELLRSGQMNGTAQIRPMLQLPALTMLEGQRCAGGAGMKAAALEAIALARRSGIGFCLLRDTTHTGALGYYTKMIADAGLAGIAAAASGPNMAYHQAAAAGVSTAPLSISLPRGPGHDPLLFDMASGAVALGKLQQARDAGQPLPAGWALNGQGRPTTDPAEAVVPLPLGGPKGSGLALMFEGLASLLSDNPILAPALGAPAAQRRHYQNGFVIALDVTQVIEPGKYSVQAQALVDVIKALPAQDGQEILMPGERGFRQARTSARDGIALRGATVSALQKIAKELGLPLP